MYDPRGVKTHFSDYFLEMYYFDDDYNKKDKERYRILYRSNHYSPIREIFKLLENNINVRI